MSLTKEQLLAAADSQPTPCPLPGGNSVYIVPLSVDAAGHVESLLESGARRGELIAYVVTHGAVDEHGTPLFAADDTETIKGKRAPLFVHLAKEILTISRFDAKDVAKLEKN